MNLETKEQIQSKLDAYEKLFTLSYGELITISADPNKFDYFMNGLAHAINSTSICYLYPYFGVIREMINNNRERLDTNEIFSSDVLKVLSHIEDYDDYSYDYKSDFYSQYESLMVSGVGLDKLDITLKEFYKNASSIFSKITSDEIDIIKTDKNYAAMVSYLSKYHPEFFRNWYMLPRIFDTLFHPKKDDFDDKKDYKTFKKIGSMVSSNMSKYGKERAKVLSKQPHGYKW